MQREELVQRPCSQNDHGKSHELKVKVTVLKGTKGPGSSSSSRPPTTICIRVSLNSYCVDQSRTSAEEGMAYTKENPSWVNSVWGCGGEERLPLIAGFFQHP